MKHRSHSIFDTVKIAREVTISSWKKSIDIYAGNFLSSQCPGRNSRRRKLVHFRLQPRDSQHFVNDRIIISISSESKLHHPATHLARPAQSVARRETSMEEGSRGVISFRQSSISERFDEYFITTERNI